MECGNPTEANPLNFNVCIEMYLHIKKEEHCYLLGTNINFKRRLALSGNLIFMFQLK